MENKFPKLFRNMNELNLNDEERKVIFDFVMNIQSDIQNIINIMLKDFVKVLELMRELQQTHGEEKAWLIGIGCIYPPLDIFLTL